VRIGPTTKNIPTIKKATPFLCSAKYCLERFKNPRVNSNKSQQFRAF
jgi:hypothetical protein